MRTFARIVFWVGLLVVAVATLGPIGLRPETGLPPQVERGIAFLIIGLSVAIAYPRHRVPALVGLVLMAGGLEALQNLVPGRHGRWGDFEAKALGVLAGSGLGLALDHMTAARGTDRGATSE